MRIRILAVIAALITYGSLYPFNFVWPVSHAAAWEKLFFDWTPFTSRGDALGNFALFLPFGFAGVFAGPGRAGSTPCVSTIVLVSLALATTLQAAQIYFPPRTPALADVVWNMLGAGLGILIARSLKPHLKLHPLAWRDAYAIPAALIVLWLAAELLPFVPSLDLQAIKNSVKAVLHGAVAPEKVMFHAAGTVTAAWALAMVLGDARALRGSLVMAAGIAAGKVLIVGNVLDVSTLLGLGLGCAGWWWLGRRPQAQRGAAVLFLLFTAYAAGALMPFAIRDTPEPFNLVPFAGLLRGSMLANSKTLAANLFFFTGILAVIRMNGLSPVPGSIALAVLVTVFEAIQIYLVGRTPDVTVPLLALLAGQGLRFMPPVSRTRDSEKLSASAPPEAVAMSRLANPRAPAPFNATAGALKLGVACVVMAGAFSMVLRLPQIPYNVRELFLGNGEFPFLMIFAFALLWIGAGARLAGHYAAVNARPYLALPLLAFGAGIVSLLLLNASVTQESIGDIAGSNNLYWFVINKSIWGEWARNLFLFVDSPPLVAFFERPVRYAALYGPMVTFLALLFCALDMRARGRIHLRNAAPLAVSALLWLWLCKGIAFDWSSTDNLNELIARDGPWGWGGGGYLYILLAMICINAVLLARMPLTLAWIAAGALVSLVLVPVGWWLLNQGLEQHVQKYGSVFSGAQFLLGPDRRNLIGPDVLFLRWSVVQLAGVLVIAAGARFVPVRPLRGMNPSDASGSRSRAY